MIHKIWNDRFAFWNSELWIRALRSHRGGLDLRHGEPQGVAVFAVLLVAVCVLQLGPQPDAPTAPRLEALQVGVLSSVVVGGLVGLPDSHVVIDDVDAIKAGLADQALLSFQAANLVEDQQTKVNGFRDAKEWINIHIEAEILTWWPSTTWWMKHLKGQYYLFYSAIL